MEKKIEKDGYIKICINASVWFVGNISLVPIPRKIQATVNIHFKNRKENTSMPWKGILL